MLDGLPSHSPTAVSLTVRSDSRRHPWQWWLLWPLKPRFTFLLRCRSYRAGLSMSVQGGKFLPTAVWPPRSSAQVLNDVSHRMKRKSWWSVECGFCPSWASGRTSIHLPSSWTLGTSALSAMCSGVSRMQPMCQKLSRLPACCSIRSAW